MTRTRLISAVTCAAALAAGCGKADGRKTLVMVSKGVHPYYAPCEEGFKAAAAKLGAKADYDAPRAFEIPAQVETIENVIARHVDGIAISAVDDQSLAPVIAEASKAGIKVLTFDSPAPSSEALSYIGTLNEQAGFAAGVQLIKAMGSRGDVAVLQGGLAASNLNARYKGFEQALKTNAPQMRIVAREDTQGKIDVSTNKTEALLAAHPGLKAIFSVSAEGAAGAAPVLKERGQAGKIILAGFDDLPDTLAGIRDGSVQFCVAQQTYKMGWLAAEKLLAAIDGQSLPKQIDTGVVVVDKSNVDTYMADMKKQFAN
jgi:ribose transport system substrate-binding protein